MTMYKIFDPRYNMINEDNYSTKRFKNRFLNFFDDSSRNSYNFFKYNVFDKQVPYRLMKLNFFFFLNLGHSFFVNDQNIKSFIKKNNKLFFINDLMFGRFCNFHYKANFMLRFVVRKFPS